MSAPDQTPFAHRSPTQVIHFPLPMPPENSASSAQNMPSYHVVEAGPALPRFTSQVPANHLNPQNYAAGNTQLNSTSNHAMTVHHSINGGIGGGLPHVGFIGSSQPPAPSSFPAFPPHVLNNSWNPRGVGGYSPYPRPLYNDHHATSQRVNYPHNMHGNVIYQNNKTCDNARSAHMHQPRRFGGPSNSSSYMPPSPFLPPQNVSAYGNPMFYQDLSYFQSPLEHYKGPQSVSHYPTTRPVQNPLLSTLLVNQINYYFCDANLVGDWFLKSHMDDQGWVSIDVVADFPRVKMLTSDIRFVLDSLQASTVVEVQGYKIRRRNAWMNWIPKKNPRLAPSQSSKDLPSNFQNLKIEEGVSNQTGRNGCKDSTFADGTGKTEEPANGEVTENADSRK